MFNGKLIKVVNEFFVLFFFIIFNQLLMAQLISFFHGRLFLAEAAHTGMGRNSHLLLMIPRLVMMVGPHSTALIDFMGEIINYGYWKLKDKKKKEVK